jgi:YfiH family protein
MPGVFCTRVLTEGIDGGPQAVRSRLRELMPACRTVCLRQVHSDSIVQADEVEDGLFPEADGVVSSDGAVALCIRTADCVPVLMWDDHAGVIGAVHAGWRGLALGIVGKAVNALRSMGCSSVHVGLGPSIGPCCYEVGPDVTAALGVEPVRSRRNLPSVDLHAVARSQAAAAGVLPECIHEVNACTCCTPSYFSYRRQGPASGRNISVIGGEACSLPGLRVP